MKTDRLVSRAWRTDDAKAALGIHAPGHPTPAFGSSRAAEIPSPAPWGTAASTAHSALTRRAADKRRRGRRATSAMKAMW
jgi:hypothetical protein